MQYNAKIDSDPQIVKGFWCNVVPFEGFLYFIKRVVLPLYKLIIHSAKSTLRFIATRGCTGRSQCPTKTSNIAKRPVGRLSVIHSY